MVGESNQNVLLIHINASSFAEFEISEFQESRVDCNIKVTHFNLIMRNAIIKKIVKKNGAACSRRAKGSPFSKMF